MGSDYGARQPQLGDDQATGWKAVCCQRRGASDEPAKANETLTVGLLTWENRTGIPADLARMLYLAIHLWRKKQDAFKNLKDGTQRLLLQRNRFLMNTTINKSISDADLKNDILSELKYEPSVKATDIGVLVKDGTVTLNGFASSYWEKTCAVRAAKRVVGVNAIADDIKIKLPGSLNRTDGDIAADAAQQIKWSPSVPDDAVKVTVRDGWLTLEGNLEWWYEKNAAENAVHYLPGVKGVSNDICIKPKVSATSIESDIQAAFKRSASLDADEVTVSTSGNSVTLRGKVRTYAEKEEADRVAWAAPGVMSVDNKLSVNWSWLGD